MSSLVTPAELKRLADEMEAKKAQEAIERLRQTGDGRA